MKSYSAMGKEWHPAICTNMGGLWELYARWNVREEQMLYDSTYMWKLKKPSSQQEWLGWRLSGTEKLGGKARYW